MMKVFAVLMLCAMLVAYSRAFFSGGTAYSKAVEKEERAVNEAENGDVMDEKRDTMGEKRDVMGEKRDVMDEKRDAMGEKRDVMDVKRYIPEGLLTAAGQAVKRDVMKKPVAYLTPQKYLLSYFLKDLQESLDYMCQHTGVYLAIQQEINENKKIIEELNLDLTLTRESLAQVTKALDETREELDETLELQNKKVAFSVQLEGRPTIASDAIFKYTTIISNIGGAYNSTTGLFTVPSDGTYQFTMTMMPERRSAYAAIYSSVNKSTELCQAYGPKQITGASCNVITYLHQGDTVYVKNPNHAAMYNRFYNTFSGFAVKLEH